MKQVIQNKNSSFIILTWLTAFLLSTANISVKALVSSRTTVIHKIFVNGKISKSTNVTIARSDSITFEYRCKIDSTIEPVPFLFNTSLQAKNLKQRQQQTLGTSTVTYTRLPEDQYLFSSQALLPGQWKALPTSIEFIVNDSVAADIKNKEKLESERIRLSKISKDTSKVAVNANSGLSFVVIVSMLGITAIAAVGFAAVLYKKKLRNSKDKIRFIRDRNDSGLSNNDPNNKEINSVSRQNSTESHKNFSGVDMNHDEAVPQMKELIEENTSLRAEIAALRGQIDNLQVRSDELYKQNKTLEETVKRIEENKRELEELQAQKDDLFTMIIHDLKNPASIVKGLVELLRSYDLNATEQQEVMNDLMETSKRIVFLSQEVCKVMALEAGQVHLNYESADISEILNSVCQRNNAIATQKSIGLIVDIAADMPAVELDPQRIEEVVDNLVGNAIKFSNSGTKIKVRSYRDGENIVVEVSDNGVGMTEEDIKRAFGRGIKLSARPTGGEQSSGLGLWIVKRLIEDHKGRVWVRSTIGRGSTFAFQIPQHRPRS